ncbi:MAG: DUF5118 domain-containing protein [Sphingobacterium sp.]|nr:DUF5118 domain-containing protein [Sphingobacterium sp.]
MKSSSASSSSWPWSVPLAAQRKPKDQDRRHAPAVKQEAPAPAKPAEGEPKPYDKVVTRRFQDPVRASSRSTRSKSKVFFEIPQAELGKDFLLVVQIKKSPSAASYPGQGVEDMVVRWELRENKVLLRAISYANIADPNDPIEKAVEAMNTADDRHGLQRRGPGRRRRPGHRRRASSSPAT